MVSMSSGAAVPWHVAGVYPVNTQALRLPLSLNGLPAGCPPQTSSAVDQVPAVDALHEVQERNELELAEQHCRRLLDVGDPSKEHAKALLAELHALRAAEHSDDMAVDSDSDPQTPSSPPQARALWG